MADTPPLKLVESASAYDDPLDQVKELDGLIDNLIKQNANLKEDLDNIRIALGMTRIEFEEFKDRGFKLERNLPPVEKALDDIIQKLEKVLGE